MLEISVRYSNERVAFEEDFEVPGGAAQSGAARRRVGGGARGGDFGRRRHANATIFQRRSVPRSGGGKIRCSEAAEKGGAIAHQVHGAIGFTIEHILHRYSLRALGGATTGSESYWAVELGKLVAAVAPMNCGRWWPRADINTALPAETRHDRSPSFRSDPPAERMRAVAQGSARLPRGRNRRRHLRSAPAQPRRHRCAGVLPQGRRARAGSA